jgi:class 3 adenylate cyclase/TolB-like protein
MARDQRRLAAIVSADVAGYSRLMGEDESRTLAALKAHRRELIDPKIAEYGGRIVKTMGDGLLLDFPSVVDAVRCAVDVQRGMVERNAGVPIDRRIVFRIGVNVGDIIIDGDDIYGDGVNVAARLQALAEPGEICVSKVVRDQVLDKLSFAFEDLGPREVKNIARPVEVYRILDAPPAATARPQRVVGRGWIFSRITRGARWGWLAGAAALAIGGGIALSYEFTQSRTPAAITGPPLMSVAVMPFTPASTGADDERLAERLTKDVTAGVERAQRSALVVSHGLVVAKYKGKQIDPRPVGHDLNVRYLLEGEVRDENGAIAVIAQLVETENGTQVWSSRVVAPTVSDGKGEIAANVANRVQQALYDAERKRVASLRRQSVNAMELVLHADALWKQDQSPKGRLAARKLYEEALRHDHASVPAMDGVMYTIGDELEHDPRADQERLLKELDDLSLRAVQLDPNDPRVWMDRAYALEWQQRWDAALEASAEGMRIDPYRVETLIARAWALIFSGRAEEALPVIDRGTALDPQRPEGSLIFGQCVARLNLGHYDNAIGDCEKFLAISDDWYGYVFLVGAYAQQGDMAKATAARALALKRDPDVSIERVKALRVWRNPVFMQQLETHLFPGLRKAGIPEQ